MPSGTVVVGMAAQVGPLAVGAGHAAELGAMFGRDAR